MSITTRKLLILGLTLTVVFAGLQVFAAGPNLIAAFFVKGKVGLKWQKVTDVDEYRIYRKAPSGEFELLTTVADDHYFDVDIQPGTTYNYKIAIVDAGGKEVFSGPKTVTVPGQKGEFVAPSWVGIRTDQGKILLNWDPTPNAVAYNIYRSTTPGSGFEVVGNSQGSSYADKADLNAGTTYYYVLTAMNSEFEETPHSEEMSVKFGMSAEERKKMEDEASAVKLVELNLTHLYDLTVDTDEGEMNQPVDVYTDSNNQVFVTDALNSRVHCFNADGKHLFTFGKDAGDDPNRYEDGSFKIPFTIYIDEDDQVYVVDIGRHDIQVFNTKGEFIRRIKVKMEDGTQPLRANGICRLDKDHLAISDTGNHRFLIVDMAGNIKSVIGKKGNGPGEFAFPGEIALSPQGELFVLDVINCRVQVLDKKGGFIREFGKAGEGVGYFGRPAGIALDPKGQVWVADNMSTMIQSFTAKGEVQSILGSARDQWKFVSPRGIHFVGSRMYVVDRLSNKVIVFNNG